MIVTLDQAFKKHIKKINENKKKGEVIILTLVQCYILL